MWALENQTPFAAERTWVRDKNGAEVWVVAVKATWTIHPDGSTKLAKEQVEVYRVPLYRGEPGKSSLLSEADLVHTKPVTDIILHGHAYAPSGTLATQVDVTLRLGTVQKTLRVFGDRYWGEAFLGPGITDPEPFEKMPVTYERAFGGTDQIDDNPKKHGWERRNPVGTGFATKAEHLAGHLVPNVEDPHDLIGGWKDRPQPAGFGPIARDWSPRVELAGTYDQKWVDERLPLLPLDFDDRFYQSAPKDQQATGYLRGGEAVELMNLTPAGYLSFALPRVWLTFSTELGRERVEHRANLHTVTLEPDVPRVIMLWHTMLPCHGKDQKLYRTIIGQKEFVPLGGGELAGD